eukprot:Skav228057  [mRNA]  locus=scaffold2067:61799:64739:- [translate_table: standard]
MLVGNTLSPKIQATLNVGERRFCVNVPLQVHGTAASGDDKDLTGHTVHIDRRILDFVVGLDTVRWRARVCELNKLGMVQLCELIEEINEVVEGSNLYKPSATLEQLVLPEEPRAAKGLGFRCSVGCGPDTEAIQFPGRPFLPSPTRLRFCKYRKSSGLDDVIAHGPLDCSEYFFANGGLIRQWDPKATHIYRIEEATSG